MKESIKNYVTKRAKEIKNTQQTHKGITIKKPVGRQGFKDPEKITVKNVCFWYEEKGHLFGSQKGKARRFVDLDLIKPMSQDRYEVLPLPKNSQTHIVEKVNNRWKCGCQRNRRLDKICSHIDAVKLKLFIEKWNK